MERGSSWVLAASLLLSVVIVSITALVIGFKAEIKERIQVKYGTRLEGIKGQLQFTKGKKARLLAKQGSTAATERPIGNVPFARLGSSLGTPLPKGCVNRSRPLPQWIKEAGYDAIYFCDLKEYTSDMWNPYVTDVLVFTKKDEIKRLRWILEDSGKDRVFERLKREYQALGYEYAEVYGLPIEETYKLAKGYKDDEETAFRYRRGKAQRTYKTKEGLIEIDLKFDGIWIEEIAK